MRVRKYGVGLLFFSLLTGCMIMPYYKVMPYLPLVEGHVYDSIEKKPIEDAKVYWKNDKVKDVIAKTDREGYFRIEQIDKYIKWKFVVMDSAWGGTIRIEKVGYIDKEISVGGMRESFYFDAVLVRTEE